MNAFFADEPVGYSDDLYGKVPHKLELAEIEIPARLAAAVQEHARLLKALADSARALGTQVDAAHVLPPIVSSPDWESIKTE